MNADDTVLQHRWITSRDAEAFAELVNRHAGMAYAACLRILHNHADAEEVVQDCFFRLSQAERVIDRSLAGWLHRVATNRALDLRRSAQRRAAREERYASASPTLTVSDWQDLQPIIDEAIAALPEELREPLVLHFFEGLTHAETAQRIGLSRSATTRRIQHAVESLRDELKARKVLVTAAILSASLAAAAAAATPATFLAELKKIGLTAAGVRGAPAERAPRRRAIWAMALAAVLLLGGYTVARVVARDPRPSPPPAPARAAKMPAPAPVAAAQPQPPVAVSAKPSRPAVAAPIFEADAERFELLCTGPDGSPIAGTEVYVEALHSSIRPMTMPASPDDFQSTLIGPLLTDAGGTVTVPLRIDSSPGANTYYSAYARGPGDLVGAWRYFPPDAMWHTTEIGMVESETIPGTVTVPPDYDATRVEIKVLTINVKNTLTGFASNFSPSRKYGDTLLPDYFVTRPARDGSFAIAGIPAGGAFYLAATAPGLGEAQFYTWGDKAIDHIEMTMAAEAMIEGRVIIAPGMNAAAGAAVFAEPSGRFKTIGVTEAFAATTDHLGQFRFTGLPREEYTVFVQQYGNPPELIGAIVSGVETVPGEVTEGVEIVLERGALLKGKVVDAESGAGVADAVLVAMNKGNATEGSGQSLGSATTGADGGFQFRLPTGASYLYFFSFPEAYAPPAKQGRRALFVAAGESRLPDLTLKLSRRSEDAQRHAMATLRGRVVDRDGNALARVPIAVDSKQMVGEDARQNSIHAGVTDTQGNYTTQVLAHGTNQIVAGGDTFSRAESAEVTLKADEVHVLPDLVVEAFPATIEVTVSNVDGEAISGADIIVAEADGDTPLAETRSDAQGYAQIHIPARPVLVHVAHDHYQWQQFEAVPGGAYEVVLEPR